MPEKTCKNCETILRPEDKYCSRCGQSASVKRLQIKHIRKDVMKDVLKKFLHADSGALHLTKALAVRPGYAIGEYLAGKRKEYYEPLKYLTFTIGISVLLNAYFDLMSVEGGHTNPITAFVSEHINIIFFISVPIAAAFSWLFFKQKGFNYAEHLALHAFLGGFRTVFFLLVFTPLVVFFRHYYFQIVGIYFAIWTVYIAWANVQLLGGPKWLTILKSVGILVCTQMTINLLIFAGAWLYFRSWYYSNLKTTLNVSIFGSQVCGGP